MRTSLLLAGLAVGAGAAPAVAQQPAAARTFLEARAGAVVPTFDIADVAKTGGAFGATLGYAINDRWTLMAEFDNGMHKDKATGNVDIATRHYIGKIGYSLTGPRARGWEAAVNLGAGAVTFDVDGGNAFTYFAINAGAKIVYNVNRSFGIVLSPQGDIAFSKKSELGTTNAWVWPFTAGLRVRF